MVNLQSEFTEFHGKIKLSYSDKHSTEALSSYLRRNIV